MASPLMGPVKPIDAPLQQLAGSTRVATTACRPFLEGDVERAATVVHTAYGSSLSQASPPAPLRGP